MKKPTIQTVRPENPEKNLQSKPSVPRIRKNNLQSKPSGPRIRRKSYNPNRPARESGNPKKNVQFNRFCLVGVGWLLVVVDNPRRGPLWGQRRNLIFTSRPRYKRERAYRSFIKTNLGDPMWHCQVTCSGVSRWACGVSGFTGHTMSHLFIWDYGQVERIYQIFICNHPRRTNLRFQDGAIPINITSPSVANVFNVF